jgi:putative endonuclease
MYYVYILECADGTLYTGITTDVKRRLAEHKAGTGGAYTRSHGARRMVYSESQPDRSSASKREAAIKKLSRAQKSSLRTTRVRRRAAIVRP